MNNDVSLLEKVKSMSRDELLDMQAMIAGLLEKSPVAAESAPQPKAKAKRQHSAPYFEIKTIGGFKYKYKRWYEGGKLRSEYVEKL